MLRILIAARNEVGNALRQQLGGTYEILESSDAAEAVAVALQQKPDCILADLGLPGSVGFELCEIFSSFSATRLIPVFALADRPAAEYRNSFPTLGVADYLQLPVSIAELKKRLVRVLRRKPLERRRVTRVRLNSILKITGTDAYGAVFELPTMADDVSATGFLCACNRALKQNAVVKVFLMSKDEPYVGRARMVRTQWRNTAWQRCGFEFLDAPQHWIEG